MWFIGKFFSLLHTDLVTQWSELNTESLRPRVRIPAASCGSKLERGVSLCRGAPSGISFVRAWSRLALKYFQHATAEFLCWQLFGSIIAISIFTRKIGPQD